MPAHRALLDRYAAILRAGSGPRHAPPTVGSHLDWHAFVAPVKSANAAAAAAGGGGGGGGGANGGGASLSGVQIGLGAIFRLLLGV